MVYEVYRCVGVCVYIYIACSESEKEEQQNRTERVFQMWNVKLFVKRNKSAFSMGRESMKITVCMGGARTESWARRDNGPQAQIIANFN